MKVLEINHVNFGSTGKIMLNIAELGRHHGIDVLTISSQYKGEHKAISGHKYLDKKTNTIMHKYFGMFFGIEDFFSTAATRNLRKIINIFQPDIIHFHILHGYYLNLKKTFSFFSTLNCKFVWTFHDCWSFTGRCPYFQLTGCGKWKIGCEKCPYDKRLYPASYFFDLTKKNWFLKKRLFTSLKNLTIVTPSQWLADLVKQSFLKDYPIKVINNGIDLSVFKPLKSNFREKHGIKDNEYILLGVAFSWGKRKGLDVFIELSKRLSDEYKIVLVGTNDNVDKQLPNNIISIHRTQNQTELAEIYSAADLFVNPTREDNYPTVNMESIACGTPVLTFKTGGSPEILDEFCGSVVDCDDVDSLEKEIIRICETKPYSKEACLERAKSFDMNDRFKEYIDLYEQL